MFRILSLICLSCFASFCAAQIPLLSSQPYFRGLIGGLPGANSGGEFRPSDGDTERPVVSISDGLLQGFILRTVNNRKIYSFQNIPYAEPPIGDLRWAAPVKNKPWNGIRNALPQSPQCTQLDLVRGLQIHGQEDCLYLNVYMPSLSNHTDKPLPVMVWIHGGGFFFGSGGIYGPKYLLDQQVVLVTVNYRLGPFGFFSTGDATSPGNQGMKDQVLALKWVQDNIAAFGGDPSSVTIFGQSVGASAVGLHVVSPLSRGLFHRAITQSSSSLCFWANIHNSSETARKVGEIYKCPTDSSENMINCLRKVPDKLLAPVQLAFVEWFLYPLVVFGPTEEPNLPGAFMTKSPERYYMDGEAANVTMIAGLTANEMSWLVSSLILDPIHVNDINTKWNQVGPIMLGIDEDKVEKIWQFYMGSNKLSWNTRHQFVNLFGDRFVSECTLQAMRYHSRYTSSPVYSYHFTYKGRFSSVQQYGGKPEDWGVAHLDDLIYLVNSPDYYSSLDRDHPDAEMSKIFTQIWANFATYDVPYLPGNNSTWRPISKSTNDLSPVQYLDLNLTPKMTVVDPYEERYRFWRTEINPNP